MNESEKPSYFSILTAPVRYDKRLKPNAKLLYSEITALTEATGVCTATNRYFARLYEVSPETISRWINQLAKFGYIESEVVRNEKREIISRRITLLIKTSIPIDEKIKENNTSNNSNNARTRARFEPPTSEQVAAYCRERKNGIDPDQFVDFYQSKNWMIGKTKMKDWQAAVRTWEKRQNEKSGRIDTRSRRGQHAAVSAYLDGELAKS